METIREFAPADRYVYDFGDCSARNGFAQIDTSQDAGYFGTWANPEKFIIVNYCEGDVTIQTADNAGEFAAEIRSIKKWNEESGHMFHGIDGMCNYDLIARFWLVGLSDLLH